jgi:hypothetical protein
MPVVLTAAAVLITAAACVPRVIVGKSNYKPYSIDPDLARSLPLLPAVACTRSWWEDSRAPPLAPLWRD